MLEDDATVLSRAAVAALAREGHEILACMGRQVYRHTQAHAIESKFIAGLRVTDRET